MIKARCIKPNARSRRDESRRAKQQAWAATNPLMVGRSYQNVGETVEVIQRPGYIPQHLTGIAALARREVKGYRNQIIRATYLFEYEFKRKSAPEGAMCLPDVAIYSAGFRKKTDSVTAR